MRVIISPAKKMREDDSLLPETLPELLPKTGQLLSYLRGLTPAERKKLWACSDAIAAENEARLADTDLTRRLTPAAYSYEGIQYQYMSPSVFDRDMLAWIRSHLRILSGFYGVLRPMDGIVPYRLEMQARARPCGSKHLYDFWGSSLYESVLPEDRTILNLASDEYARSIRKYLKPEDRFITCVFGEIENGKLVQKGVYAKMARGEMVRFLAEISAETPEQAQGFDRLDYVFHPEYSSGEAYVFLREPRSAGTRPAFEWE